MKTISLAFAALLALFTSTTLTSRADVNSSTLERSSCAVPNRDAAVTELFDDVPTMARDQQVSGTSIVQVRLTQNGGLAQASLSNSSGNSILDAAALRIARLSRYEAETQNCQRVDGSYLLPIEINANEPER